MTLLFAMKNHGKRNLWMNKQFCNALLLKLFPRTILDAYCWAKGNKYKNKFAKRLLFLYFSLVAFTVDIWLSTLDNELGDNNTTICTLQSCAMSKTCVVSFCILKIEMCTLTLAYLTNCLKWNLCKTTLNV